MPNVNQDIKLDFKDVLLRPKRSKIRSRADVSIVKINLGIFYLNPEIVVSFRLKSTFVCQKFCLLTSFFLLCQC